MTSYQRQLQILKRVIDRNYSYLLTDEHYRMLLVSDNRSKALDELFQEELSQELLNSSDNHRDVLGPVSTGHRGLDNRSTSDDRKIKYKTSDISESVSGTVQRDLPR